MYKNEIFTGELEIGFAFMAQMIDLNAAMVNGCPYLSTNFEKIIYKGMKSSSKNF